MSEQATYAKKVLFTWWSPDHSERIVVFEDGSLELSSRGRGMGKTITSIFDELWEEEPPMESKKEEWCEHIKLTPRGWIFRRDYSGGYQAHDIADYEEYCLMCGAKRPEEKKRLADIVKKAGRDYAVEQGVILPNKNIKREDEFFNRIAAVAMEWAEEIVKEFDNYRFTKDELLKRMKDRL